MYHYLKIEQIQLRVDGRGDNSPIANNNTESGRALNRRVQITFLK